MIIKENVKTKILWKRLNIKYGIAVNDHSDLI